MTSERHTNKNNKNNNIYVPKTGASSRSKSQSETLLKQHSYIALTTALVPKSEFRCQYIYRGSPTSTVSTSTISTSTNFSAIGIKFVLVGLQCSKIRTSGNQLCSTKQYDFRVVRFFQNPKNRTKRGPPVAYYSASADCENCSFGHCLINLHQKYSILYPLLEN